MKQKTSHLPSKGRPTGKPAAKAIHAVKNQPAMNKPKTMTPGKNAPMMGSCVID